MTFVSEFEYHNVKAEEQEWNEIKCECGVICLSTTEWKKHVEEEHDGS